VPAAGSTAAEVLIAAEAALGPLDPALRVRSSDEILAEIGASVDSQMAPFRIMQQGLVFVSFVAVLSTLLLVGMQRQRETGLLAAVGAAPPDLRRTVLTEALLVGAAAVIQAVVLGLVMLWALTQIVPVIIGFRNPYQVAWGTSLGAAATALVVTAMAAAWPAWRASKVEVLEALRYE
jgi:putative ABC transport system permease protein